MKKFLLLLVSMYTCLYASADKIALVATGASYTGDGTTAEISALKGSATGICDFTLSGGNITSNQIRWYANQTVTFTPANGVTLTKISWTDTNNADANTLLSLTNNSEGKVTKTQVGTSTKNASGYWEGSTTKAVCIKTNKQIRTAYFEIEYTKSSTGPQQYTPSFSDQTLTIGETGQLNLGENHPAISYACNPAGIVSIDENGTITALAAGSTGVTASWGGDGTWESGEATFTVTVNKKDFVLNFPALSLEIGRTHQLELGDSHPEVLFISNDDNVATVDETTGLITAVAAGTTDITAAWDANDTWNAGETSFKLTVTKPLADPQFSFRHDVVYGKLGVGVVGQAGRYLGDGKTTYSSSDETVVTVNPNTGMITPADVHKAGTATITANLEATADYKAATASYTVVIEAPNEGGLSDDDPATFDFTTQAPYGLDPKSSSNAYETEITEITSVTPITLSFTGKYRNWKADNDFRLYPAATMTFAVPEGFAITKITINQTQGSFTADNGTVGTEYKEWNAETADGTQKVTFTITTQLRIKTMTVGLKKTGSTLLPAQLSFTNKTYNELVNNDIIVNAVNNPNNVGQIYYSIDNLTEGEDYTIMSQGDNLKLNVKEIGVYTLRAKSEATETHLDGFAILRLNVFPQLTMNVDGSEPAINEDGVVLPAEGGKLSLNGEYPNTVKVFYSLNDGEEIAYDGTPIEFTDDAKLTYHMEYAETAAYRHTTNVNVLVTPAAPTYDITEGSIVNEGDIITFSTKEGTTLYYKVAIQPSEQAAAHRAPALEGWTSAEGNTFAYTVPALEEGETAVVTTKAVKGNLESAATTYGVKSGITTGVEAIEAEDNEAEVEWFNLQGVLVENPAAGLYIRRQGNKVEKVAVK